MDIALDYYRIFEAVARHRSFTRAAEALVNSQPNLTRAVHNLEAELGCRLFLRSSRGVELTPGGRGPLCPRHGRPWSAARRRGRAAAPARAAQRHGLHRLQRDGPARRAAAGTQPLSPRKSRHPPARFEPVRAGGHRRPAQRPCRACRRHNAARSPVRTAGGDGAGLFPRGRRVQHDLPAGQRPAPLRSGRSRPCRSSPCGAARARLTSMRACSAAMG